jgi:ATP-dependent DNA helicase RecG
VSGQMSRIDTPALPGEAEREALANTFIHRDYASASGSVSVAQRHSPWPPDRS